MNGLRQVFISSSCQTPDYAYFRYYINGELMHTTTTETSEAFNDEYEWAANAGYEICL